jgi:hypothetical protein
MIRGAFPIVLTSLVLTCVGAAADKDAQRQPAANCPASSVHGNVVRAGPFTGFVVPPHDVVGGRFSLRVGGMRTENMSSKIPWFVPFTYKVGDSVLISGLRLHPSVRTFRQTEAIAWAVGNERGWVFPSIIDPPSVGCWRLTFRSGDAAGSLTVRVRAGIAPS